MNAEEIRQPTLASFQDPRCFFADSKPRGIVFRAVCGGATTKGSSYPRCELRELHAGDKDSEAVWSTDDGQRHTLSVRLALTHLPKKKPHVVCAQIHDKKNDVLMVRLEGSKLFIERSKNKDLTLDANYTLGTPLDLKIEATGGHIRAWYNGQQMMDWQQSRSGCYFKVGCYTQSNIDRGDAADDYGEVVVFKLSTEHAAAAR